MKSLFLVSNWLLVSFLVGLFASSHLNAAAINTTEKKIKVPPTLNAPKDAPKITVLKASDFSTKPHRLKSSEKVPAPNRAALKPKRPKPAAIGTIKAAPKGALSLSLTAKKPYFSSGFLFYDYPLSVSTQQNYIQFSKNNVPGSLGYQVKLEQGKKYLVEVLAQNHGGSGGMVQHSIGSEKSSHQLGKWDEITNISRVLQASKTGWVQGVLYQGDPEPRFWKVLEVRINEIE